MHLVHFFIFAVLIFLVAAAFYFLGHTHGVASSTPTFLLDAENEAAKADAYTAAALQYEAAKVDAYTAAALQYSEAEGKRFVAAVEKDAAAVKAKL
jgi:hypothetical protein